MLFDLVVAPQLTDIAGPRVHIRPIEGWRRHASPLSLVVFGVVVALALSGWLDDVENPFELLL